MSKNKYVDLESKVYMKYHIDAIATKISKNVIVVVVVVVVDTISCLSGMLLRNTFPCVLIAFSGTTLQNLKRSSEQIPPKCLRKPSTTILNTICCFGSSIAKSAQCTEGFAHTCSGTCQKQKRQQTSASSLQCTWDEAADPWQEMMGGPVDHKEGQLQGMLPVQELWHHRNLEIFHQQQPWKVAQDISMQSHH